MFRLNTVRLQVGDRVTLSGAPTAPTNEGTVTYVDEKNAGYRIRFDSDGITDFYDETSMLADIRAGRILVNGVAPEGKW